MEVTEVFPSAVLRCDLTEAVDDIVKKKIDNIAQNMCDDIYSCDARWSKDKLNDILELAKFDDLKKKVVECFTEMSGIYGALNLNKMNSFLINIPKNGYLDVRKSFNSTFTSVINFSEEREIMITNPSVYTLALGYETAEPNRYNSQYGLFSIPKYGMIILPSNIYYGFRKENQETNLLITSIS